MMAQTFDFCPQCGIQKSASLKVCSACYDHMHSISKANSLSVLSKLCAEFPGLLNDAPINGADLISYLTDMINNRTVLKMYLNNETNERDNRGHNQT